MEAPGSLSGSLRFPIRRKRRRKRQRDLRLLSQKVLLPLSTPHLLSDVQLVSLDLSGIGNVICSICDDSDKVRYASLHLFNCSNGSIGSFTQVSSGLWRCFLMASFKDVLIKDKSGAFL